MIEWPLSDLTKFIMSSSSKPSFEPGDVVVVQILNHHLVTEEAGVVLKVNCQYKNNEGKSCKDGIMVKLKISNTKGVHPPDRVQPYLSTSTPSMKRRKQPQAKVTPSPSSTKRKAGEIASKKKATGQRQQKSTQAPKENSPKRSKFFAQPSAKTTDGEETGSMSTASADESDLKFRVQKAPSKAAKCQSCKIVISKDSIRLQQLSSKKGWYHARCINTMFEGQMIQPVGKMEGYSDLSAADQLLLEAELRGDSEDDSDDSMLISLRKTSKQRTAKKKIAKDDNVMKVSSDSDSDMLHASESDSDDDKDMPFRVEYAPTARATCRGCDERIAKHALRVGETPLFRGKPGFMIFRHLDCTIFSEHINEIQDIGGWRRLKKADKKLLADRIKESKRLVEEENKELKPDELVQASFEGEIRKSPPGLTAKLLPFQVEGTSWMYCQEVNAPEIRGGIMADEMGMGKTLQTITAILDNRPKLQHSKPGAKHPPAASDLDARKQEEQLWSDARKSWDHEMKMINVPKKVFQQSKKKTNVGARAGTLVVCPVIALYQWAEEIKKFTEDKTLSVCIYHGPKRATEHPQELLCKYDIVLTTYQVIEADFRKMVSPNKVKCPNCGGAFKIDKLRVHLKYFCGETARKTEAQARQRRIADRPIHRGTGNDGKTKKKSFAAKSKSKTSAKAKSTTKKVVNKSTAKTPARKMAKKSVHIKRVKGYDSDSDLSVAEDIDISPGRPSRAAAKSASKKLSQSAKQWGRDDNESSESEESKTFQSTSDDESSEDEVSSSSSDDSSSEDETKTSAFARARKKQKLALESAVKPFQKKNKKKDDESSTDEDSDSEIEQANIDPLAGIDLDALLEEAMAGSRLSVLHTVCWWRVVLDEAHVIKSRSSGTAAAAFSLTSIHRWCLSGTPLQNRVGELYSLIRFLRIDPMAHYFCRREGCDCKSIHYRMMHGKCQDCGHGSVQHYSHFNKHILNPIKRSGYSWDGRRAMMKLKNEVLDKALIRRTKETRAEDMNLPPRVVNIRTIRLHPREEDFYNGLYTQTKNSFNDYVDEGTLLNNYAHIFDLLTKMRQAVDHPYLIVHSKKNPGRNLQQNTQAIANGRTDCALCHDPPVRRVVSSCCGSAFCRSCVQDFIDSRIWGDTTTRCPYCNEPLSIDLDQRDSDVVDEGVLSYAGGKGSKDSATAGMPSLKEMPHVSSGSILRRINLAEFATSTKIEALVQELVQMRQERPGSKALVFSQFVNMLDLIRWRLHSDPCLHDLGLGVRIIHGGMNVQSRDASLKDFNDDSSVRVLLMSLKAGGVALNLTVANEAYLIDPWWNP